MECTLSNITVSTIDGALAQGKLSFIRSKFSFRLMTDALSVIIFGSQHVKSASQGQSWRARPQLVFLCIFAETDQNYLPWKHDGKLNFPRTVITLSWLRRDTRSQLS